MEKSQIPSKQIQLSQGKMFTSVLGCQVKMESQSIAVFF